MDFGRSRTGRTLELTCCHGGVADSISMLCPASRPFQEWTFVSIER